MRKRWLALCAGIGIGVAGLVVGIGALTHAFSFSSAFWSWSGSGGSSSLRPVSDVSESTRACLFVAPAGDPLARTALQGLTAAAQAHKNMLVQQFTVPAKAPAGAMLGELIALHCSTIVAVGSQAQTQVTAQVAAHAHAGTRYLVIGSGLPRTAGITVLSPASATAGAVKAAVLRSAGS